MQVKADLSFEGTFRGRRWVSKGNSSAREVQGYQVIGEERSNLTVKG